MKKYLLGVFAVILAIGFSAFTNSTAHKSKSVASLHYYFVDGTTIGAYIGDYDITNPTDLAQLKIDSECENNPVAQVCALGFEEMDPEDVGDGTAPIRRTE